MSSIQSEVAIVGAGPVGLAVAGLLARRGHEVVVVERHLKPYGLPRAVRFDGQAMRLFQELGVVDAIAPEAVAADSYRWFGADGDEILCIDESRPGPSGWAASYSFWQPTLEQALERLAADSPTITLLRGRELGAIAWDAKRVTIGVRVSAEGAAAGIAAAEPKAISARYLIGADGANSAVRKRCGITLEDLGFSERWLVADVRPDDPAACERWPVAAQRCDPRRPTTIVRAGARHRRWEFMLLPGERAEDVAAPDAVWALLQPYLGPDEASLVRSAVYTFTGRIATRWTAGPVVLAGDAAHTMPPFMAEGLCTGLRDAANLAWRLDLLLRGIGDDALLSDYAAERSAHARALIELSIAMGRVSCLLDAGQAAERDAAFRSGDAPPPPPRPGLVGGTLQRAPHDPAVVGQLAVQGVVTTAAGARGRLDDVVGTGFVVLLRDGDPSALLGGEDHDFLRRLGAHVVTLGTGRPETITDVDGALSAWLDAHGLAAAVIRPDGYGFGASGDLEAVPALIGELRTRLSPRLTAALT